MNGNRMAAVEVKKRLRTVVFPDGDDVVNQDIRAFCKLVANGLDRFFFEEWITPQAFAEQYFQTLKSIDEKSIEQPAMEDLVAAALGSVANAIFPPDFAEQVKQEAVTYIIRSGMFREEQPPGAWEH